VQAVNYLDLNVEKLGVDLLTLSGSKIEGAGRVGVLYITSSVTSPSRQISAGENQEMGLRPGTENFTGDFKFSLTALQLGAKKIEKQNKAFNKTSRLLL